MHLKRDKNAVNRRRVTGRVSTQKARSDSKDAETSTYPPTIKGIRPYDKPFEQHIIDHGIHPFGYEHDQAKGKPNNWSEIQKRLSQPRPSLSPSKFSEESFERKRRSGAPTIRQVNLKRTRSPLTQATCR